jgi:acetolactate synthase-1/2/3 large subunit
VRTNASSTRIFLPAEIDEHYQPEFELVGDLAHTLWMLNERVRERGLPTFDLRRQQDVRRRMLEEFAAHADDDTQGSVSAAESSRGRAPDHGCR